MLSPTQVKQYRALQEQASTYLDLVCSVCDLSDDAVRVAAAHVQQIKLMVSHIPAYSADKIVLLITVICIFVSQIEERMSNAQELSEGWREIKEQKQELHNFFQDVEQQLLSFSRRPAELETKIAQNMVSQVKVGNIILSMGNNVVYLFIKIFCSSFCHLVDGVLGLKTFPLTV